MGDLGDCCECPHRQPQPIAANPAGLGTASPTATAQLVEGRHAQQRARSRPHDTCNSVPTKVGTYQSDCPLVAICSLVQRHRPAANIRNSSTFPTFLIGLRALTAHPRHATDNGWHGLAIPFDECVVYACLPASCIPCARRRLAIRPRLYGGRCVGALCPPAFHTCLRYCNHAPSATLAFARGWRPASCTRTPR